jgi:hypothetical protein
LRQPIVNRWLRLGAAERVPGDLVVRRNPAPPAHDAGVHAELEVLGGRLYLADTALCVVDV